MQYLRLPFKIIPSTTVNMFLAVLLLYYFVLGSHALQYRGADISSLSVVEKQGTTFTDEGNAFPFEKILSSHGCNSARIRVWTSGQYSLSSGLDLAKRVKAARMTLVVDLHFSDDCRYIPNQFSSFAYSNINTFRGGCWPSGNPF